MRLATDSAGFDRARRVADAVLYEGYLLFPYRSDAGKNRYRWQWGVVVPHAQAAMAEVTEPWEVGCDLLVAGPLDGRVQATVRFLHVEERRVEERRDGEWVRVESTEVGEDLLVSWDEGAESEVDAPVASVADLREGAVVPIALDERDHSEHPEGRTDLRIRRVREPLSGTLRLSAEAAGDDLHRLRIRVDNRTAWSDTEAPRDAVLRRSFVGCHVMLGAEGCEFASLLDPPGHAADAAATCRNEGLYPVLAGEPGQTDLVLASPIILYDHPETADETEGDSFDATEIDELLSLTVASLSDDEKRRARATDPKAREIVDRADAMPPEILERLHGTIRSMGAVDDPGRDREQREALAELLGVGEPGRTSVTVGPTTVLVGSRVRLRPNRRADAQDAFIDGKTARVARIMEDVEGETYVAVTLEDDPGADITDWYGRYLYFQPDEIEPLDEHAEEHA